jgi:outer membrane protein assembly factor BamB
MVLFGSCAGYFIALDRNDGSEIWSYNTKQDGTPAQFHGDPLIVDGLVITGSDRSSLPHTYAFDIATGDLIWKHGGSALESNILPAAGYAVGRRWNGDLLAIDVATGDRAWALQPKDYTHRFRFDCSPAAMGDTVFFGGVDGFLYAVDGRAGDLIWAYDAGCAITTAVVIAGDDIYVGLANQKLIRIAASDGRLLGSTPLEKSPIGQPAVSDNAVMVMVGRGNLVAFSRDLGDEIWRQDGAPRWTTPRPLIWRDLAIVGTQDGVVKGFSVTTGEEELELILDGRIRGLGADGDILYIGAMNGNLVACRPKLVY